MSRAAAAQLAGMERQALRDAVLRYNTEDLAGLRDHPKGRPQRRLTEGEEAALAAVILRGPEPDRDGCCAWTRADLCHWIAAHFGKSYYQRVVDVTRGFPRQRFRDSFNSHQMWGLERGRRSRSRKIERLPSCVGWPGGNGAAGLRRGFMRLPMRLTG